MPTPIYLDHNATTPVLPEVAEAMRACWTAPYLNPASQHEFGRRARRVLEDSRERVGELLGAERNDRVIFTSGGTEANNLALLGLLGARHPFGNPGSLVPSKLIVSSLEHPSITTLADHLSEIGHTIDRVTADSNGTISTIDLARLIQPETRLVAAMLANNETGVIQPVAELADICNKQEVPLHTDAAQAAGKLPINFRELGATTMTIAAHKLGGPLGIGALVCREHLELRPQLFGGFQQAGLRPGTESVALAVGMCRALEFWHAERADRAILMRALRDRFEAAILAGYPGAEIIGAKADRLPHVSNIAFVGLDRQALFMAIDQAGVACSTGSACASGSSEPSASLVAMGLPEAVISSSLRFSLGATTTAADIDEAVRRILRCCNDLRRPK
jgi:cysteine desulfurase